MSKFNLTVDPWISVVPLVGEQKEVSMMDLFENANQYRCLAGETETQDFAVMRLLLAVLQTVFSRFDAEGNPNPNMELDEYMKQIKELDPDDNQENYEFLDETWERLFEKGHFPEIVSKYLKIWHEHFYLLDDKFPFYQVSKQEIYSLLPTEKGDAVCKGNTYGKTINRLISESNNKEALFSPVLNSDKRQKDNMSASELARWLITFQGYIGLWDKIKNLVPASVKSSRGWLFDLGGIYLQGDNLFETLMMNLILDSKREEDTAPAIQKPCWERTGLEVITNLRRRKVIDNLAELYTNWSRLIYIDPSYELGTPVNIGIAKLPEIEHSDAFLEPMTIWKMNNSGDNKGHFTPRKHPPEQSLWRSFGMITLKDSDEQHRPEVLNQLERINNVVGSRWITIRAVSMQDDGNATSWVPVDEVKDSLNLNDLVISDQAAGGWVLRLNDIVSVTKDVIGHVYRAFLKDIEEIRGLSQTNFVIRNLEEAYALIDEPFRNWLESISPADSKDNKIAEWKEQLKSLMRNQAQLMIEEAGARDYKGIIKEDQTINIVTAYLSFARRLDNKLN